MKRVSRGVSSLQRVRSLKSKPWRAEAALEVCLSVRAGVGAAEEWGRFGKEAAAEFAVKLAVCRLLRGGPVQAL